MFDQYCTSAYETRRVVYVSEIAHQCDDATIHWYLDKHYMASTNESHAISIKPRVGYHSITAVDYEGSELKLFFEILPHE
jgi:membrane carboxypeptidase/penicillin-binding protein PbpC